MTATKTLRRRLIACTMLVCVAAGLPAAAQEAAPAAPSESAMVNLVRLLVKQGVLKKAAGDALMAQAEAEAAQARAAAQPVQQAQAALPDPAPGSIRVPYIPATVRAQIRDEIRTEVLAQAKAEGWASADQAAPEWTKRIRLYGDLRFRSQSDLFSKTNSPFIVDFAEINQLGPTNILTGASIPFLNAQVDRINRLRFRARIGAQIAVTKGVTGVFALGTGDDNSPISENQSLGGGFAKRSIWLDEAYIKLAPNEMFYSKFGRFPNPFVATDLLFDEDLRFDGVAAEFNASKLIGSGYTLALRGGVFPLDFNQPGFPTTNPVKRKAPVKYLYSGQITAGATVLNDVKIGASVAYHSFQGVQGQFSEPCALYVGVTECSTDYTRAFFPRKGNTLFGIRNIAANPRDPNASGPQLLGLTYDYDVLDINGSVRVPISRLVAATLSANYVRNLSFRRGDACRNGEAGAPLNNGGAGGTLPCAALNPKPIVGGPTGYQVRAIIGPESFYKKNEWNVIAGYRYLESDAVLDSLTDSDFHLGGTNAKGYFIGGSYGIFDNVNIGARWLSSNAIAGEEPLAIDVLQLDLEAKF